MSAPPARVLVVDDEVEHATTLVRLLRRDGLTAEAVHCVSDAMTALNRSSFDVVLSDLLMPGKDGLDLLRAVDHLQIDVDIIVMTAFGTVERAVEAMKAGAYDFLVKPVRRTTVLRAVRRALERRTLRKENAALRAALARHQGEGTRIVGVSSALRAVLDTTRQAAQSDATVLLLGESGTGKELFAREIHERSHRHAGPFVALHCAALPDTIIESELFGHEAGAFTGASGRRAGRFEAADGGTLFLDEIGELNADTQVKLLRVLQEGEVVRVGGNHPLRVDVRIVAATNRDLDAMVREGRFREDLYYRLHVIPVRLPPLRERREDIPLLAATLIASSAARNRRRIDGCTDEALEALRGAEWPGNVRQLQNVLERAVVLDNDGRIGLDDLPDLDPAGTPRSPPTLRIPVGTPLAEVERRTILATLAHAEGDKSLAASLLGVGRRTIYRKLDEYAALEEDEESGSDPAASATDRAPR